jgi:hypothetical protein
MNHPALHLEPRHAYPQGRCMIRCRPAGGEAVLDGAGPGGVDFVGESEVGENLEGYGMVSGNGL